MGDDSLAQSRQFYQEFVGSCPTSPAEVNRQLMKRNMLGGLDVSDGFDNEMLLCVTEMNTRAEIDALVSALSEIG